MLALPIKNLIDDEPIYMKMNKSVDNVTNTYNNDSYSYLF